MSTAAGKTVVITGASRGIGKQTAIALGALGANIVIAARTVEPRRSLAGTIAETAAEVEAAGGQALAVAVDLTSPDAPERLVAEAVARFGGIDVLINNAADTSGGSLTSWERSGWEQQITTNLLAPIALMAAVIPVMTERGGGIIVNMTSGAGDLTARSDQPVGSEADRVGKQFAYATSKAGLNRLGNIVAPELAAHGIAVVTVDPGLVLTELLAFMGTRGVVDTTDARPMDDPVRTILAVVTAADPLRFSGELLRTATFGPD